MWPRWANDLKKICCLQSKTVKVGGILWFSWIDASKDDHVNQSWGSNVKVSSLFPACALISSMWIVFAFLDDNQSCNFHEMMCKKIDLLFLFDFISIGKLFQDRINDIEHTLQVSISFSYILWKNLMAVQQIVDF